MKLTETVITSNDVADLTKEELTALLKEIRKIGNARVPKNVKQSPLMQELFKKEKTEWNFWVDQYHGVDTAISNEILFRIRTDKW